MRGWWTEFTTAKVVHMEAKRGHDDVVMSSALSAHQALLPHEVGLFLLVDFARPQKKQATEEALPATPGRPYYNPIAEAFAFEK